jgi:hypothetical protein
MDIIDPVSKQSVKLPTNPSLNGSDHQQKDVNTDSTTTIVNNSTDGKNKRTAFRQDFARLLVSTLTNNNTPNESVSCKTNAIAGNISWYCVDIVPE